MMSVKVFQVGQAYMDGLNRHVSASYTCNRRRQETLRKDPKRLPEGLRGKPREKCH